MLYIETLTITDFAQNCRILADPSSQTALVIDPGGSVEEILTVLNDKKLKCLEIWLTHSHLDHCGGVMKLQEATGAKLIAHPAEKEMRSHVKEICQAYGIPVGTMNNCPEPETYIHGGEVLSFGPYDFKVLFTPGHSPGHVSFFCPQQKFVISGDALFAGSIGRTDFPGGHHQTLLDSIRQQLFSLPDETRVLSGHGPDTTIGKEKRTNPFFVGDSNE